MIGTIRTRRETFVGAVIAKARWQLPGILPIDPNDLAAIGAANVNYPARYVSRAGSPRQKHKQTELRGKPPHQTLAMTGEVAEYDLSTVNAVRRQADSEA